VSALDSSEEAVVDPLHDVVRIVVVIAEEGGLVPEGKAHLFFALPVFLQCVHKLLKGISLIFVDMLLDRRKAVCDRTDTAALDVVCVVAGPAVVVVLALLDAVPDDDGEECGGHLRRVLVAEIIVDFDLSLHSIVELFLESGIEIVECFELADVTCLDADLLACEHVYAVRKCVLKEFRHIEISVEQICLLACRARLDASARAALARVFKRLAYSHLFLYDHVGVEDRGISHAVAEDLCCGADNAVRRTFADLDVALGLQKAKFVKYLKANVSDFTRSVAAVGLEPCKVDVRKVVVRSALCGSHADLGRCGGVVDLDPEAGK